MNDAFRCRDLPAMMRLLVKPEDMKPEWWVRTHPMDPFTEEDYRLARDNEIIRRIREAGEDHGE